MIRQEGLEKLALTGPGEGMKNRGKKSNAEFMLLNLRTRKKWLMKEQKLIRATKENCGKA